MERLPKDSTGSEHPGFGAPFLQRLIRRTLLEQQIFEG